MAAVSLDASDLKQKAFRGGAGLLEVTSPHARLRCHVTCSPLAAELARSLEKRDAEPAPPGIRAPACELSVVDAWSAAPFCDGDDALIVALLGKDGRIAHESEAAAGDSTVLKVAGPGSIVDADGPLAVEVRRAATNEVFARGAVDPSAFFKDRLLRCDLRRADDPNLPCAATIRIRRLARCSLSIFDARLVDPHGDAICNVKVQGNSVSSSNPSASADFHEVVDLVLADDDVGDAAFVEIDVVEAASGAALGTATFSGRDLAAPTRRSLAPVVKDGQVVGELGFAASTSCFRRPPRGEDDDDPADLAKCAVLDATLTDFEIADGDVDAVEVDAYVRGAKIIPRAESRRRRGRDADISLVNRGAAAAVA